MTVEEIFSQLSTHSIRGTMVHAQLADYYDFLGLRGYKRMHEYHYFAESLSLRNIHRYYINHHNKLIQETAVDSSSIIPEQMGRYMQLDIDVNSKRNAIKTTFLMWRDWEKETKELYEKLYVDLINEGHVATAFFVKTLIYDVDEELEDVTRMVNLLKAVDYDMSVIVPMQKELHDKYRKKLKEMEFCYYGEYT